MCCGCGRCLSLRLGLHGCFRCCFGSSCLLGCRLSCSSLRYDSPGNCLCLRTSLRCEDGDA